MGNLYTSKSLINQYQSSNIYAWQNAGTFTDPHSSPGTLISSFSAADMTVIKPQTQQTYMHYGSALQCGNARTVIGADGYNQSGQSNEGLLELKEINGTHITTISNPQSYNGGQKFAECVGIGCDRIVAGPTLVSSVYKLPMYDLEGTFLDYLEVPEYYYTNVYTGTTYAYGIQIQDDRIFFSNGSGGTLVWDIHGNFINYISSSSIRGSAGEGLYHTGYGSSLRDITGCSVSSTQPDGASTTDTGGLVLTSGLAVGCRGTVDLYNSTYQEVEEADLEDEFGSTNFGWMRSDGNHSMRAHLVAGGDNYRYCLRAIGIVEPTYNVFEHGGLLITSHGGTNLNTYGSDWMYPTWHYDSGGPPDNNMGCSVGFDLGYAWAGSTYIVTNANHTVDCGAVCYQSISGGFTPQRSMFCSLS